MIIQILNIFEKYLFKRYSEKYGIFHELFTPDQLGLEVRNIDFERAQMLKSSFLQKGVMSYLRERKDGSCCDFLALSTFSTFREILEDSNFSEHDELQTLLLKRLQNYAGISGWNGSFIEELGIKTNGFVSMGILNVTPDSFSDGGKYFEKESAVKHALEMLEAGADIIDVGGVSTRPGAKDVEESVEAERVLPVVEAILKERADAVISVDTTKASIAEKALSLGAKIINDISGGTFDERMFETVAKFNAALVIMHIKGKPENMQKQPYYTDVVDEIFEFLEAQTIKAKKKGVEKIIVDPGIGFGKRVEDNYEIISRLREFKSLGFPLLIGLSRKSMLGNALNIGVEQRDVPTIIAETISARNGADIIRSHNVEYLNYLKRINELVNNPTAFVND